MSKIEKISSIVIAKNEEQNIKRCIESQLKCIDEIIVLVDKESTDNTFEIASSYDEVVCQKTEWKGFSDTKKEAAELATNSWIFWIDADEEITESLCKELNSLKGTNTQYSAFKIARRAYFLNKWIKHSGWYPGYVTRLFNKISCSFDSSAVHEGLLIDGKVGTLKNDLNHYTDPSIEHYFEKFNRYTSLAANDMHGKNKITTVIDIIIRPFWKFIQMYFFRLGILDGKRGFMLAVFSSSYVFTKYCKLWELNNKEE